MDSCSGLKIVNVEEFRTVLPSWLQQVILHHSSNLSPWRVLPLRVRLRKMFSGHEIDMVVEYGKTRIGFELKQDDYEKACSQALDRRPLFKYFYIVFAMKTTSIFDIIHHLKNCLEAGVGLASSIDNTVIIYSKIRNIQKLKERARQIDYWANING